MKPLIPFRPDNPAVVLWALYAALVWVPLGFWLGRESAPEKVVVETKTDTLRTALDDYGEPYLMELSGKYSCFWNAGEQKGGENE